MPGDSQEDYWVEDFTEEEEAAELLALRGNREDWEQFVKACPLAALFALFCHEGPCAALVGVRSRWLPRSGFGANLRKVQRAGDAGSQNGADAEEGPRGGAGWYSRTNARSEVMQQARRS